MARHPSVRLTAAAVVVGLAFATAGMSIPATAAVPEKAKITLTVTELPAQVRLIPGEAVKLRLATNVTTGYSWTTKVTGAKKAVSVSAGKYTAPTTELVGAPGTTTWVVAAVAPGTAKVTVLTTPPGEDTTTKVGTLTVIVQ
jgi:predicted secreted protein